MDKEQLDILRQGVPVWNQWRRKKLVYDIVGVWGADLSGRHLEDVDFRKTILVGANFQGARLARADLTEANMAHADVQGADLTGAAMDATYLFNTDLSKADLVGANLGGANFVRTNLSQANLSNAYMFGTHFFEAILDGTNFSGARLSSSAFTNVDLRNAVGLERAVYLGPCSLGIDSLLRSGGKIPEEFLRGIGLPDSFIDYAASLTSKPVEFFSCFISYSTKDQDFADRLYADLQTNGVRCWFAPEDLKIGDKMMDTIDQSIRLHDKLLIVLSENSISSDWVEIEVKKAMAEERRRGRVMLFPIRLDRDVMETDEAWAATIREDRHIGDFRQWKDHDRYQEAFNRLLRDLKQSEVEVQP